MLKEKKGYQVSSLNTKRETTQFLMPPYKDVKASTTQFDLYPSFSLGANKIFSGYTTLSDLIATKEVICLDGFSGVNWEIVVDDLLNALEPKNLNVKFIDFSEFLKSEKEIESMTSPFLGDEESVWGTRCDLTMQDFFDLKKINSLKIDEAYDLTIVYGFGSNLVKFDNTLIYLDFPKNELQYRMRAGSVTNLGLSSKKEDFKMYKHYYFIDWVVMNSEKQRLASKIDVLVDAQQEHDPSWAFMSDLKSGLEDLSKSIFRVRPWFEPGAWGGDWIKEHINGLNKEVINYAWAFSLIVPENGLLFESDGRLLELSFDFLMNQQAENVLGSQNKKFGNEFPIRFNFLDTYKGGNLSIQCHPSLKYIQENFGENITQDECYYILDCDANANVYLGFQEDIDPAKFKADLLKSQEENVKLEITDYVQKHRSQKHDLYLIPNGTIHSAGSGNMVLEISATPYIFTFKMYDWLRLDLNGKPRPINIDHAFNNLKFEYKGENVKKELFSHKEQLETGEDYKIIHLPTHKEHFYDVRRFDFNTSIERFTDGSCQVMMLVEGERVLVETKNGYRQILNYAETFVVPAAAEWFKLTNLGENEIKVINSYLK